MVVGGTEEGLVQQVLMYCRKIANLERSLKSGKSRTWWFGRREKRRRKAFRGARPSPLAPFHPETP